MLKRQHKIILDKKMEKTVQFEINKLDSLHLEIEVEEVETLDTAKVELFFKKPDESIVSEVITGKNQNKITIDVKNGALDIPGIIIGQIKITEANNTISTHMFRFYVKDTITSDDAELNYMSASKVSKLLKSIDDINVRLNKKADIQQVDTQLNLVKDKRYVKYKNNDKAYVCLIFDDLRNDLGKVFGIFKEYGLPLTVAVPSNVLMKKSNYQGFVDLLNDIQDNGGEVLAHGYAYGYIDASSTFQDAYREIILPKEELSECGFNVDGWVRPGGSGALENLNGFQSLVEDNYLYAFDVDGSSPLMKFGGSHRMSLPNYTNSSEFITRMETAITHKEFISYYAHTLDGTDGNLTEAMLRECLQYLKDNKNRIEVITPKDYYDKFIEGGNRQERINTETNLKNVGIAIQEINNKINSYAFSKNILDPNLVNSDGSLNPKWIYNDGGTGSSNRYYLENGSEFRFTFFTTPTSANGTGTMKLSYTTNKVYIRPGDTLRAGFYSRNLFGTMTIKLNVIIKYKNETNEITELTKTINKDNNLTLTSFDFVPSKTNAEVDYIKYEVTVNRPTADANNSLVYFSLPYLNILNKNNQYGVLL